MNFPLCLQTFTINSEALPLYVPDAEAVRNAYRNGSISFPYWSKVWPSAIALSEFVAEHSSLIQKKSVLELGAGLGLPSLSAARHATSVLCTDANADAVDVAAKSVLHLRLKNVQACVLDWAQLPDGLTADVVLLSDVNYAPDTFDVLTAMMDRFLHQGSAIVLSTPQRLMARPFVKTLSQYCVVQEERKADGTAVTVMVLELNKGRTKTGREFF